MENKVMTAKEAVERFIHPGCHIAFGGFTILRRPMAIAREIVRQNIGELFVTMNGGTIVEEMLAGAGLIKWLETTYLGMDGGMPVAYAVRRGIELGEIELVEDYSNWSFAQRTLAGRLGLPFMPCMGNMGTDLLSYDIFGEAGLRGKKEDGSPMHAGIPCKKFEIIDDPFEGYGLRPAAFEDGKADSCGNATNIYRRRGAFSKAYTGKEGVKVMVVPPLKPEVTVIHAQRVAIDGTVRMEGLVGADFDQGLCGRDLIVECERVCPVDELRHIPEHNQIAPHFVKAIVPQPFGAYPTVVPNYYDYDYDWFTTYTREVNHKPMEEVRAWWLHHVADTKDDWDYLDQRVGLAKMAALRTDPRYHYNPDIDRFGGEHR